ncbi:MAG: two-component regulator propeller domain-containing protein [Muribaculaceae bacterium]
MEIQKGMFRNVASTLVLLSISICLFASDYSFLRVGSKDGLSPSHVKAILQDNYGFMWFGTKNGLCRYDGFSVTTYKCFDYVAKQGNNNIGALYKSKNGDLWVGTDEGIYIYNIESEQFKLMNPKTENGTIMRSWVNVITEDSAGNIWIMIPEQGAFRYDKSNKLHHYLITHADDNLAQVGTSLFADNEGDVWVPTRNHGLMRYDAKNDKFKRIINDAKNQSLNNLDISTITRKGDSLYLGIYDGNVIRYNLKNNVVERIAGLDLSHTLTLSIINYNNEIWIGTNKGIYIITKNNEIEHLERNLIQESSLSDNTVFSFYTDSNNGLWIGTFFGGANYFSNTRFTFKQYTEGTGANNLSSKIIRELAEDKNGNIWIGTENSNLCVLTPRTGAIKHIKAPIRSSSGVLALTINNDKVYCGENKHRLTILDLNGNTINGGNSENIENRIWSYLVDSKGNHWMGTDLGLYKSVGNSSDFKHVFNTGEDWIYDILESKDGTIWFATMGSGVWKYDSTIGSFLKFVHVSNDNNSISSNLITSITEDKNGNIWFSTECGGISRYNVSKHTFTSFSIKDGLPDDFSYKILEDAHGALWFGTNKGLVKFNPITKDVQVFTVNDGISDNQFNYKSALKATDGKFYFGTINGLMSFDPNTFDKNLKTPSIYFSGLKIGNQSITPNSPESPLTKSLLTTSEIELPHDKTNITFTVSLLSYESKSSNKFYYRLIPSDKEWNSLPKGSVISFLSLAPGTYTLQVRTSLDKYSPISSIKIKILPPWFLTIWAELSYVFLIICVVGIWFLWYRRRKENQLKESQLLFTIEKEKELKQQKIDFFTTIAHEVRTPLSLINGPLEILKDQEIKDTKIVFNLNIIERNVKRLLYLTSQLLDFHKIDSKTIELRFENVDISSLLQETFVRFEPTFTHRNKNISITIPEIDVIAFVDREAITKILSNILNNALKYGKQEIRVKLRSDDDNFYISVESDGERISEGNSTLIFEPFYRIEDKKNSETGSGMGLPLSKSLAIHHGGKLYLDAECENNRFILEVPFNKEAIKKHAQVVSHEDNIQLSETTFVDIEWASCTILLVEDNEEMLSFLESRLKEYFNVVTARNGQEGFDLIQNASIDIVVSDIMMPIMDGCELCKLIKADMNTCHIPVIFLTAKNDIDSKINGLKVGAEAYVEKPFSFNYLKSQILSLLSNRQKERETFSKRPYFSINNMQMNKIDEDFMKKVIEIINSNIADEAFGVEQLADTLCISRSSLLRKIKILFNLSPVHFIRLIRLKKATELIASGKYKIGEIGYMVGINAPSYFSKLFLQQFGISPKDFEKQTVAKKKSTTSIDIDELQN